ncbi:MAG: aminopeptidase [Clostridia bacterium]|nr:aminopeptidase [Clostridia bacterium]
MTEELKNKLIYKPKSAYDTAKAEDINDFCIGYKKFMDLSKTEREAVAFAKAAAEENGFKPFDRNAPLKAGDKVYYVNREKSIVLAVIGSKPVETGANIVVAHVDSPRLDLKQRPLYEDGGIAYFKTHYYGGIKKYQWTAMPLSLHGTVIKSNGEKINIALGDGADEAAFYISDLMPHIAKDQIDKPLGTAISGEGLNIIVGSVPCDEDSNPIKLAVLNALYDKYGITEKDLITAEISAVPADNARDIGFDRGMIAAYGHDDRICAYPSMCALFDDEMPERTCICIFADKEEIGSYGVTGMSSAAYKNFLNDICAVSGANFSAFCENSVCLSADVGGAYDACYGDAYDAKNSAYVNKGVVVTKYTGARGKSGSSDASAELVAKITGVLDREGVAWQTGEYGKVDQGGAGTVATEIALLNIDVIDVGVPILSMHSPYELASKADIYAMYKAAKAFFTL